MADSNSVNVLIVSKGHDYNHDSFLAMFAAMERVNATLVEQPAGAGVAATPVPGRL